ncbi:MAG: phosphotransferase, partial [Bacillota bacterium]
DPGQRSEDPRILGTPPHGLDGNLVIAEDTPVPIDFSLSGLGFYLQDVAQCISNIKKPLRPSYLDGYGRAFSAEELVQMSAYILMIIFITPCSTCLAVHIISSERTTRRCMPLSGISDVGSSNWGWLWLVFFLTLVFLIVTLLLAGVWWRLDA